VAKEQQQEQLHREALRLLGDRTTSALSGESSFFAGSLLLAADRPREALKHFESCLARDKGSYIDSSRLGAASANLALDRPEQAGALLLAIENRQTDPGVTGGYDELALELVGAYESAGSYQEAMPFLDQVRDSGNAELAPLAARWIPYMLKESGQWPLAEAAAREALARFKDDENLVGRMRNFLRQEGLTHQPLPELPPFQWLAGTAPPTATVTSLCRGRVALIDVWSTWCGPCRRSFPFLRQLLGQHGEHGLVVLSLTRFYGYYQDERSKIPDTPPDVELGHMEEFIGRHAMTWPVGVTSEGETLFTALGVAGIPHFVLLDREGLVNATFMGETPMVQKLIQESIVRLLES